MTIAQKQTEIDAILIVKTVIAESLSQIELFQFCRIEQLLVEKRKLKQGNKCTCAAPIIRDGHCGLCGKDLE